MKISIKDTVIEISTNWILVPVVFSHLLPKRFWPQNTLYLEETLLVLYFHFFFGGGRVRFYKIGLL